MKYNDLEGSKSFLDLICSPLGLLISILLGILGILISLIPFLK